MPGALSGAVESSYLPQCIFCQLMDYPVAFTQAPMSCVFDQKLDTNVGIIYAPLKHCRKDDLRMPLADTRLPTVFGNAGYGDYTRPEKALFPFAHQIV